MTTRYPWKRGLLALAALPLVFAVACSSGDSDDEDTETTAEATATEEMTATATAETTEGATATATETMADSFGLADLDGLVCTGEWRNLTFGSTGPFSATFSTGTSGGSVSLELGGNVFGAQGGTVNAPFSTDGDTTVIEADLGFLGQAMFTFAGTDAKEASLGSPPALGPGSDVSLRDFEFDGKVLNASVDITFADGSKAESVLESTCG